MANGPKIVITSSCDGCAYVNYDYFTNTSWQCGKRCLHPSIKEEQVSPRNHITPSWCPELEISIKRAIKAYMPEAKIIKKIEDEEVYWDKTYKE